jgi:CRISPR-associated protein Cas2
MMIIISYDVSTSTASGVKRLRKVAKVCENYGLRVQNSVFECIVNFAEFEKLKHLLLKAIDEEMDSLRFYKLGNHWENRIEHYGTKSVANLNQPLIL